PRRDRDGAGAVHQDPPDRCGHPRRRWRAHPPHADAHRQGAQHVGHRGLRGDRSQWRGGRRRLPAAEGPPRPCQGDSRGAGDVRGALRSGVHAARPVVRAGVLPDTRHPFRSRDGPRQAVSLFRVRRRGLGGGGRALYRRLPRAARGHPAGRRRFDLSDHRSRPGRRGLRAGNGLADAGGAPVGRPWAPRDRRCVHLQAAVMVRDARGLSCQLPPGGAAVVGGVRQQGRRRAAADARHLRARGAARRGRRLRRRRRRHLRQPGDARANLFRRAPGPPSRCALRRTGASGAHGTAMSVAQLFRSTLFHTISNPFHDAGALHAHDDGGLLVRDGRVVTCGSFDEVRRADAEATVVDWRGGVVVPGFVDAHVHYPQLRIVGRLGRSLLDWLEHAALPEEARMADEAYATETAVRFVGALAEHGTTTALVFGAHFAAATASLFDAAAAAGLRIVSGLVISDRYVPPPLRQTVEGAYRDSSELIARFHRRGRMLYAVTPRFALSTSDAMLEMCQTLVGEHAGVRVQSHLNEDRGEIRKVAETFPWARDYTAVYDRFGLTGAHAVLAHNVHATDAELERLAATRTSIAHCPASNAALGSGLFPLRRHVDAGVRVALGTDVGGGTGLGMLKEGLQA